MWPVGKAVPAATDCCSELSSQSEQAPTAGSNTQRTSWPSANGGEGAAAVGVAQQIVEHVVDAPRLPLAVDRSGLLGELLVVTVDSLDAGEQPIAERPDEIARQRLPHRSDGGVVDRARAVVGRTDRHSAGGGGSAEIPCQGIEVAVRLLVGSRQDVIDGAHGLLAAQLVEHVVLLVGEDALELAATADDQWCQRLVAALERRRRGRLVGCRPRSGRLRARSPRSPSAAGRTGCRRRWP